MNIGEIKWSRLCGKEWLGTEIILDGKATNVWFYLKRVPHPKYERRMIWTISCFEGFEPVIPARPIAKGSGSMKSLLSLATKYVERTAPELFR